MFCRPCSKLAVKPNNQILSLNSSLNYTASPILPPSSTPAVAWPSLPPSTSPLCNDRLQAVHRKYNASTGETFYTTDIAEASAPGWTYQGIAFYISQDDKTENVPFYRFLLGNGKHFYTTSSDGEGTVNDRPPAKMEGVVGYLKRENICDTVPLHRNFRPNPFDHLYTVDSTENQNIKSIGYQYEGVPGYVWTSPILPSASSAPKEPQPLLNLYNTGVDDSRMVLSSGQTDPHWTGAMVTNSQGVWPANNTSSAWLGWSDDAPSGTFIVTTSFDLTGFDLSSVKLYLKVMVDNVMSDVILNGVRTGFSHNYWNWKSFALSSGFISGKNTLSLEFFNLPHPPPNPAGIRAELFGTAIPL